MAAIAYSNRNERAETGGVGPLVKLVLVIALIAAAGYTISHAVSKHGEDALEVRECLDKGGALQVWFRPEDGRWANVCQLGKTRWGVQIIDDIGEEITAFIRNKNTRLAQVERYLARQRYIRWQ